MTFKAVDIERQRIETKSGFDVMKAAAEKAGLNIVAIEAFGSKDTDFSAQLTKIRALKPDAVGISALVEPISGVLLQARQLGIGPETLFIGGNGSNSPKLGEIAGAAAEAAERVRTVSYLREFRLVRRVHDEARRSSAAREEQHGATDCIGPHPRRRVRLAEEWGGRGAGTSRRPRRISTGWA